MTNRNRIKYKKTPGDYTNAEITREVNKTKSIKFAAHTLEVSDVSLATAIRARRISVYTTRRGGGSSRYDWAAIEKAWRNRPEKIAGSTFALSFGMSPSYFYHSAEQRGFYTASPNANTRREEKRASLRRGVRIEDMTRANKDKALAALNNILHDQRMAELVCQERRELLGAMGQAGTRPSIRSGAA